jgi:hypothetical protein
MIRFSRWAVVALLTIMFCSPWIPLRAQNDKGGQTIPSEVNALFEDIIDIDKLRVLNPLKLTPEQITQLIATVKEWQGKYNKQLADAAVPPIKSIAAEIKETRKKMVAGALIPKDFDDKVKGIQSKFTERRSQAEFDTVKGLAESVKKILTSEQAASAEKMAKEAVADKGKDPPKLNYFNVYVLSIFIQYSRIIPLLEQMKTAQSS